MIKIKTASLAISLAVLATAANAQSVVSYSDSQGYGYRMEPLLPYAPPQRATTRVETRASAAAKPAKKVDAALIAEPRNKRKPITTSNTKPKAGADVTASIDKTPDHKKITKTIVVREKPIVRNTYRVVEHPPIVVQREVSEDQVGEGGGPGARFATCGATRCTTWRTNCRRAHHPRRSGNHHSRARPHEHPAFSPAGWQRRQCEADKARDQAGIQAGTQALGRRRHQDQDQDPVIAPVIRRARASRHKARPRRHSTHSGWQ